MNVPSSTRIFRPLSLLIAKVAMLLALLFLVPQVQAQTLWQATKFGMTVEEAAIAVPGSTPPIDKPATLATGAVEKLRLDGYEVAQQRFRVVLFFRGDQLEQVTLALQDQMSYPSTRLLYERLREALNSLHGPVEEKPETRNSVMGLRQGDWRSRRTNISLLTVGIGDHPATLNINYQVRVAKDADRL